MSERSPSPETTSAPDGYGAGLGAVTGALAGAAFVNEFLPPIMHPVPGLTYEPRLMLQPGIDLHWGTIGGSAPHALMHVPVGIDSTVTKLTIQSAGPQNTFKTVAEVAHQLPHIADQTLLAVAEHLVVGGAAGATIGAYAALRASKSLREHGLRERLQQATPLGKLAAAAAAVLALGGGAQTAYQDIAHPDHVPKAYFSANITKHSPKLKGAYLTGVDPRNEADLERDFTYVNNSYNKDNSSPQSNPATDNFRMAWNKAEQTYLGKYTNNSDDEQVVQLGDIHCYYPGYAFLTAELTQIGPDIIVDNGDIQTNSGQAPYEGKCIPDEIKAFRAAATANRIVLHVVRENGNHDAKKSVTMTTGNVRIYTLRGAHNTKTIDGMTFVGDDDPRQTIFSTVPDGRQATDKALALQGSHVATTACQITEATGQAPFVMTHAEQGSYESLLKGCAKIAFNAHTHVNGSINVYYGGDGLQEYQHTVGTATGVGTGITIYQKPVLDATITDWFINKRTHEPDTVITVAQHTDGTVTIDNQSVTGDPQIPSDYENYLVKHYSPTAHIPVRINPSGHTLPTPVLGYQGSH